MIEIALRIDDQFVQSVRYEAAFGLPIPEVGESVVNPQTDGLAVKVVRRIFEYRTEGIRVTLDCN